MTEPVANGITLREFFERLFNDHAIAHREHQAAHDREHRFAQTAIDTAAELAKENKRDANEWRDAMTDRERAFARAESLEQLRIDADRRISQLERNESQAQGALSVARFIGAGGFLTGLAALIWSIVQGAG